MLIKKMSVFVILIACITLPFLSCSSSHESFTYDESIITETAAEMMSVIPTAPEAYQDILSETESETEIQTETVAPASIEPVIEDENENIKGLLSIKSVIPRKIPTITDDADKKFSSTRVIDPSKPMIALTFDDGPSSYTEAIVDKLNEYNSAATFFVVGTQIQRYSSVIRYIVDSGSEIGNHTAAHPYLTSLNLYEIDAQIMDVQEQIYAITGLYPTLVRPPYGSYNDFVIESVMFPLILWSVDTNDWRYPNPQRISDYIMENARDGAVILMHDSRETTKDAMLITIEKLIDEGFQLVTVSELFQAKNISLEPGNTYNSAK